jgi:hypothetical protein
MGITSVRTELQKEGMDEALRVALWNVLDLAMWQDLRGEHYLIWDAPLTVLVKRIWWHFLDQPLDRLPDTSSEVVEDFRSIVLGDSDWHYVFDFIEFLVQETGDTHGRMPVQLNAVLKRHMSAYRIIGDQVVEVTEEEQVAAIETALTDTRPLSGVREHLQNALRLFSDRETPDYPNSIKESISAVEAMCRLVIGDSNATLGKALKKIEPELAVHPALKGAFDKLYGYTSNQGGIRHAMVDDTQVGLTEARYMLVACSAFVSYLIDKANEAGISLESPD